MKSSVAVFLVALLAAGCAGPSIGPGTIQANRHDYNEAISRSWDEQLLLNLVRLRYRDSPLFVDVTSITSSYSFTRGASVGGRVAAESSNLADANAAASITFADNPVISYSYLSGEQFAQRLLTPLAVSDLRGLAQSGWSIERLLLCCAHSVNGIGNAVAAAGPTPDYVPEFERFHRVAALFRRLQLAGQLQWEYVSDGIHFRLHEAAGPDGEELRRLLGIDPRADRYDVVPAGRGRTTSQIATQGRPLLGVLYFLSHAVDVPPAHLAEGKVTRTRDPVGAEFDWARVVGGLLRIRSGAAIPANAAVRVQLRGHWYWIEDSDLNSKTTFSLLRLLLFLKSGERQQSAPVMTIPSR
jgi:hypothetical protein